MSSGEVIKKYRLKNELSRPELAGMLDISRNTLMNWEKEQYEKAVADLKALEDKKDEEKRAQIIEAVMASGKSYDEILAFLQEQ